jgi:hypothetical protein
MFLLQRKFSRSLLVEIHNYWQKFTIVYHFVFERLRKEYSSGTSTLSVVTIITDQPDSPWDSLCLK